MSSEFTRCPSHGMLANSLLAVCFSFLWVCDDDIDGIYMFFCMLFFLHFRSIKSESTRISIIFHAFEWYACVVESIESNRLCNEIAVENFEQMYLFGFK